MVWGWRNGIDLPLNVPSNAQFVLGFNEPNFHPQVRDSKHTSDRERGGGGGGRRRESGRRRTGEGGKDSGRGRTGEGGRG